MRLPDLPTPNFLVVYSSDQNCVLSPKMGYFPNFVCTHGKRLLPTLTKCARTFGNTENTAKVQFFLIHLSQNHNVTPCKNQCILAYIIEAKLCCLLVTYCTGLIQVLIFNKMQIPCNSHVCFLLNNVCCCDRHIHAHNQFRDHRFSPRVPIS